MPAFQITNRIKQDVRNARMVGEFTVKIGAQKLPGVIWGMVSRIRSSVYPEAAPRVRPEEYVPTTNNHVLITSHPAEPRDGYDLLTGAQVVELLSAVDPKVAQSILEYECTHRNRAIVVSAAEAAITR
jgi:hypothetical protein